MKGAGKGGDEGGATKYRAGTDMIRRDASDGRVSGLVARII